MNKTIKPMQPLMGNEYSDEIVYVVNNYMGIVLPPCRRESVVIAGITHLVDKKVFSMAIFTCCYT